MDESSTNILNVPESALNLLKKSDLVTVAVVFLLCSYFVIEKCIIADADLYKLCEKIERLTEGMNQIVAEYKKLQKDIVAAKNVNHRLEDGAIRW